MKKYGVILIVIWALAVILTGCKDQASAAASDLASQMVFLDAGKWPQNHYTDMVPKPEFGVVEQAWVNSEQKSCAVVLAEITQEDLEEYQKKLQDDGFVRIAEAEEAMEGNTSIGLLYTKGETSVSIAFYEGRCTLGIFLQ